MPTAIIKIRTAEGFVFASDGLARDDKGNIESENEQKIFQIGSLPVAYGISGPSVKMCGRGTSEVVFDFVDAFREVAGEIAPNPPDDSFALVSALCDGVHAKFLKVQPVVSPKAYAEDGRMAHVVCCGYWGGTHFGINIHICLVDGKSAVFEPYRYEDNVVFGSTKVAHFLTGLERDKERSFARFARPFIQNKNVSYYTLDEAVEYAKTYIAACASDEGRKVDPKFCPAIGGRVQIATIVLGAGFRWLLGYEPIQSTVK
jgi:hypothetical protein